MSGVRCVRSAAGAALLPVLLAMAAVSLLGLLLLLTQGSETPRSPEPGRIRLLYAADGGPRAAAQRATRDADGLEALRRLSLASGPAGAPLAESEERVVDGGGPWFSLPAENGVPVDVARPVLAGVARDPDSDLRSVDQAGFAVEVHRVRARASSGGEGEARAAASLWCAPVPVDVSRLPEPLSAVGLPGTALVPDGSPGSADGGRWIRETAAQSGRRVRPTLVTPPNDLSLFLNDVHGYAAFARAAAGRRRLLAQRDAAGALRLLDAGSGGAQGTGREVFSFVPRDAGPSAAGSPALDAEGPAAFGDVFVDASWAGGGAPCPSSVGEGGHCQWRTLLVAGLGAAGRSVAALDVTGADVRLLWEYKGEGDSGRNGRSGLAHAVSAPCLARVRTWNARAARLEERSAVVFGAGNGLHILDAATGKVLYETDRGVARILPGGQVAPRAFASIAAAVAAIDLDGDGFTDALYFGDLNGQLWRLSLPGGELPREGSGGGRAPVLLFDGTASSENAILRPVAVLGARAPAGAAPSHAVAWLSVGRVHVLFDQPLAAEGSPPAVRTLGLLSRIDSPSSSSLGTCRVPAGPRPAGWFLDLPADTFPTSDLLAVSRYLYFTAGGVRNAFFRLSVDNGDPCRGADCCAGAGEPWSLGAGRAAGFRKGGADIALLSASAPFAYADVSGTVHVAVWAVGPAGPELFDTRVPETRRLFDWSR